MTSTRRNLAIGAGVAAIGLLSFALCCAHRGDKATDVQSTAESSTAQPAVNTPAAPTTALAADPPAAVPPAEPSPNAAEPATSTQSPTARALRATDDADRNLLADIERQTHENPPDVIRELLALRRSGATRAQLDQFIEQRFVGISLAVQIAARRWVRAVAPEPGAAATSPSPVAPSFGAGGGPKRVQPVTPSTHSNP